jgi:cell division septum initiation protein DivIVA
MSDKQDDRFNRFQEEIRGAMGEAIAAFMQLANHSYRAAWEENARLRERVKYLETRVKEIEAEK